MDRFHLDIIEKYNVSVFNKKRKDILGVGIDSFSPKKPKPEKQANKANHDEFHQLVTLWTRVSLRPFNISEDELLQEVITFASSVSGNLTLPSRNTNWKNLMHEVTLMKDIIKKDILDNCLYFSATSDMWSSRTMKAFMALSKRFLTEDFMVMRSYTLEVKPVSGKHTGEMIKTEMELSFSNWALDKNQLSMMLRDSGSSMVKACNVWDINHFPCNGHSLHLVMGPFLLMPKIQTRKAKETQGVEHEEECDNNVAGAIADEDDDEDVVDDVLFDSFNSA